MKNWKRGDSRKVESLENTCKTLLTVPCIAQRNHWLTIWSVYIALHEMASSETEHSDSNLISEAISKSGNRITSAAWLEFSIVFNLSEVNIKRTPRELNRRRRRRIDERDASRSQWIAPRSSGMPAGMYICRYVRIYVMYVY